MNKIILYSNELHQFVKGINLIGSNSQLKSYTWYPYKAKTFESVDEAKQYISNFFSTNSITILAIPE